MSNGYESVVDITGASKLAGTIGYPPKSWLILQQQQNNNNTYFKPELIKAFIDAEIYPLILSNKNVPLRLTVCMISIFLLRL